MRQINKEVEREQYVKRELTRIPNEVCHEKSNRS